MTLPSQLPGGFSVNSGGQSHSFTTSGAEATIEYVGPADGEVEFLQNVFGAWNVLEETIECPEPAPSKNVCSVCQYPQAHAYAYLSTINELGNCVEDHCLWPDTFATRTTNPSNPQLFPCENSRDPMDWPIIDDCVMSVSVNYRYKNNAQWPYMLRDRCTDRLVTMPVIPQGTYLEARVRPSFEYSTVPRRHLKYSLEPGWARCEPCLKTSSNETETDTDWELSVPEDIVSANEFTSFEIEVIWENVPLPNWDIIYQANGKVNDREFLGYPYHSVLFQLEEPETMGYFGCMEAYRLRFKFIVKYEQLIVPLLSGPLSSVNTANREIVSGRIGLWNRRWHGCPIKYDLGGGRGVVTTNMVPIVNRSGGNCWSEGDHEEHEYNDFFRKTYPFKDFPLHTVFTMNVSDCCIDDEEWGTEDCNDWKRVFIKNAGPMREDNHPIYHDLGLLTATARTQVGGDQVVHPPCFTVPLPP